MARLPTPGGDDGVWGDVLNEFLSIEHNTDGSQKALPQSKITNLSTDLAAKAPINSPTFTGTVTLPGAPATDLEAATKAYVDTSVVVGESVVTVASTGADEDLDFANTVYDVTMDQSCAFTFIVPGAGRAYSMSVIVRGAFSPSWPAAVVWPNGAEPPYTTPSIYEFMTLDNGTTIYGFLSGAAFA